MIYQNRYDELMGICRQITSHKQSLAKPRIENLILAEINPVVPNDRLLAHLISESLLKRIDLQLLESKNIFVQEFDIPQIDLFYSMAEAIPFVAAANHLANQFIYESLAELDHAAVLDIGIGKGKQVSSLLQRLKTSPRRLKKLDVIGLDPVQTNLDDSRKTVEELARELPFEVEFFSICSLIEDLSDDNYHRLEEIGRGHLLINSTFTLHHTCHPIHDNEFRNRLMAKLASMKPLLITLAEPHSNHDTEDLPKRVHSSWQHFGHLFQLIDEADIESSHKFLIKEKFFGREIRDIFGVSDHFRCERHEFYDSWLLRLHKAGFKPVDKLDLEVEMPPYCTHAVSEGLIRLGYQGTTIVAVMGYEL